MNFYTGHKQAVIGPIIAERLFGSVSVQIRVKMSDFYGLIVWRERERERERERGQSYNFHPSLCFYAAWSDAKILTYIWTFYKANGRNGVSHDI